MKFKSLFPKIIFLITIILFLSCNKEPTNNLSKAYELGFLSISESGNYDISKHARISDLYYTLNDNIDEKCKDFNVIYNTINSSFTPNVNEKLNVSFSSILWDCNNHFYTFASIYIDGMDSIRIDLFNNIIPKSFKIALNIDSINVIFRKPMYDFYKQKSYKLNIRSMKIRFYISPDLKIDESYLPVVNAILKSYIYNINKICIENYGKEFSSLDVEIAKGLDFDIKLLLMINK